MAKKKAANQAEDKPEATARVEKSEKSGESKRLLKELHGNYKIATEADQENRRLAIDDLKFVHEPGAQWDPTVKKERGKDRPCYEFNKLRITIKRVINHIRANRPAGKVRAVEDGDKDTADIYDGLIRNIWNTSDADTVIDYAAEYVVAGGMGAWRVTTEYSNDTTFDQDIFIRPIKNPFCLYADPNASDPFKRDARYWILTERISNASFEERWPKANRSSFEELEFDDDDEWQDEETTRICEYWYKKPYEKTLCLLADGKTVEKSEVPPGASIVRERVVRCDKICTVIASGDAILEGPTEWAGKYFPFVMVPGEWRVIDGKVVWHGLTRFSKDAQRAYNFSRTSIAETIALAPQAKFWMTPKQFEGLGDHIADAHKKNYPVSFYNPDPAAPGPPSRIGGADVPVALVQEAGMASEDIKATSGIFDASLGHQSNETSGRAIRARQEQGEIATYNFPDNIAKGIRCTYEILIDLIPKIYDTARSIRILGADGAEKYHRINEPVQQPDGSVIVANDITRGKYDVTVTSGPSFSTQRQEAAEVYTQIGQAVPALWGVAGDLVVKSMDLPYAEQIADRMKALLPPQIQQKLGQGKPMPPEVQALMQQAEQAMAIVQQQSQLVQAAAQEVEQSKAESEKAKAEAEKVIASIKTVEAQFQEKVAKAMLQLVQKEASLVTKEAGLTTKEAQLTVQESQVGAAAEKIDLNAEAQAALEQIRQIGGDFASVAMQVAQTLAPPPPPAPKTSKRVRDIKRGPDGITALIDELDEQGNLIGTRNARVARSGDQIVGQVEELDDAGQVAGVREMRVKRGPGGELVGL